MGWTFGWPVGLDGLLGSESMVNLEMLVGLDLESLVGLELLVDWSCRPVLRRST